MKHASRRRMLLTDDVRRIGTVLLTVKPGPGPAQPTTNGTHRTSAAPSRVSLTHAELVHSLVAHELDGNSELGEVSAAAAMVSQKLSKRLAGLVGPVGSEAILSRALHLARPRFPCLQTVRAGANGHFDGLEESLRDVDRAQVEDGLVAVLTIFLDLLVSFIGEELALRVVGEVWTELALVKATQPWHG